MAAYQDLIRKANTVFPQLSAQLYLYAQDGTCLLPSDGPSLPEGLYIQPLNTVPPASIGIEENHPGAKDILTLAAMLLQSSESEASSVEDVPGFFKQLLCGRIASSEALSKAAQLHVAADLPRSVVLFNFDRQEVLPHLQDTLPLSDTDLLIPIAPGHIVLLMDMTAIDGPDEIQQFAEAACETLLEENGVSVTIGIGEEKKHLLSLGESYQQALKAVELGHIFRPSQQVFMYRRLLLQRLLAVIPQEECLNQTQMLFNSDTAKLFNQEMLSTLATFFEKDLNLSDTARQLFIHRNTLVYRLDKIQKQTGLDLRRFDDAVTFKLLHELHLYAENNQTNQQ